MKPGAQRSGTNLAVVDAMLADPKGQPRIEAPATLRARTMDALRHEASRPTPARRAGAPLVWRMTAGAIGVGVVAAAWMFAIQVIETRSPPPAPTEPTVRRASLAVVANIDERLFDESKAAATRIATAVNASYRHELDAMREDARRAAERAVVYTRWITPTRDADGTLAAPEP